MIRCRYGLVPGPKQTYEEIAGRLGVSRERVRQIEREALDRLRLWVSAPTDLIRPSGPITRLRRAGQASRSGPPTAQE